MPRYQGLIQFFSDGAKLTAKEVIVISLLDKAICNAKEDIWNEKRLPNPEGYFVSVWLPYNKQKTHGTQHYARKKVNTDIYHYHFIFMFLSFSSCKFLLPSTKMQSWTQEVDNTNPKSVDFFKKLPCNESKIISL